MTYYKSVHYIDGKIKWLIKDGDGNIIRSPNREQFKTSIFDNLRIFKDRKCYKCGNTDTYIGNSGNPHWYKYYDENDIWDTKSYLCYYCYQDIDRNFDIDERVCCICGGGTYIDKNGIPCWRKNIDKDGNWDSKSYACSICYGRYNSNSQNNMMKSVSLSRNKQITITGKRDKGRIGEDIISIVLNLSNQNDISDNYNSSFDMVSNKEFGKIQVKIGSKLYGKWNFATFSDMYDTIFLLCMDRYNPWKNVERVYIIPIEAMNATHITIYENPTRSCIYDEFRISNIGPYNDTYHHILETMGQEKINKIFQVKKE